MNKKENLISSISKLLLVVGVIIGVWASLLQEGFFNPKHFLYYTIQSNIEIGIISLICVLFLLRKNAQIPQVVYALKFIFTARKGAIMYQQ